MRKWTCVPMITLCLLLVACGGSGGSENQDAAELRGPYHDMTGCTMEAVVSWTQDDQLWEGTLRCDYVPGEPATVEMLAPESIAGVKAVLDKELLRLEYEELCLNAGPLSDQDISPMAALPRLMSALGDGWLLEENQETWDEIDCLRIAVDQSGQQDGKILSTIWLRLEDGTPLRGEIAVEDEIILTAEFTSFTFYDTIDSQEPAA